MKADVCAYNCAYQPCTLLAGVAVVGNDVANKNKNKKKKKQCLALSTFIRSAFTIF